jgi:hypothetical protein
LSSVISAEAQVSIGIGLPNVSIGINLPLYPELAPVPGYPVYYAPQVNANYFFYDGMYWVYQDDNWYASSWYNGPWGFVRPEVVPSYVLRVPVRYYRQPPPYFRGWDKGKRGSAPARAPLPSYQRQYSGDRYPRAEQQHQLRNEQYRYQPRDRAVREHYNQQVRYGSPAPAQRVGREAPPVSSPRQQDTQRSAPPHQGGPDDSRSQPSYQQRGPAPQDHGRQREQQAPRAQDREQRPQDRGDGQGDERGRGHNH